MFVPSMIADSVTALDTQTGQQRWQFFTEGPVRLAPVAREGRVYFVSDDGHLYCVGAADGELIWKFRGLPAERKQRKVMGSGRLIPLVPARGGPVLADGVVDFAAGIWSDHGTAYYAGISPQGHLAIVDGKLVVPCGAQLPALLDLKTGELEKYTMGWGGRVGLAKGCAFVSGTGKYLIHAGDLYDIRQPNQERFRDSRGRRDYKSMLYLAGLTRFQIDRTNQKGLGQFRQPVLTPETMYFQQDGIVACDLSKPKFEERASSVEPSYRKNDEYPDKMKATFPQRWKLPSRSKVHIKAGGRLYCGRPGVVEAVDIPAEGQQPKISWRAEVRGTPHRMLAADGRLFVVTREGRIYAFGQDKPAKPVRYAAPSTPAPQPDRWTEKAADILGKTAVTDGYVLALGIGSGRLAEELVRQSKCDVIAVDTDADKVAGLRQRFCRAGLYGKRISIYVGDPKSYPLPPYVASLIVSEDPSVLGGAIDRTFVKRLFRSLRPYGGTACLELAAARRKAFAEEVSTCKLARASVRQAGNLVMLTRRGPLPEAANWSHSGANAANTAASQDRAVKPPLARLWFDGSFRWIRTPGRTVVRVAGGRVLIKATRLDAIDVYTGRHLWAAPLPPAHNPGGEIVAVEDAVYLTGGRACVALDPATGQRAGGLTLPDDVPGRWSNVRVADDYLVGSSGKTLLCMDRRNGKLLWKRERERNVGSIALGGRKVFCDDLIIKRRGEPQPDTSGISVGAFDLRTGEPLWQIAGATGVRYSRPHDLLVTSGGVYRAKDGTRVRGAAGVWSITDDKLLAGDAKRFVAYDLISGAKTGQQLAWNTRGCTPLRAGATLLTTRFRGNAAYVDLATGQITSIWNVRAACSNNLFPANGILNIPNLSGGCTCNYMPVSQGFVPLSVLE
jgi:outer membrane protein assembly factor BamB